MRFRFVAVFLIASLCSAQVPTTVPASPQTAPPSTASIFVPQGTAVALTLISPIKSKSTKPGDTVRAVVAFPVTVGNQLAIPAGTYVEGVVNSVSTKVTHTNSPSVKIHFTRLLFANAYSVPLDAMNTEAMRVDPSADHPQDSYEIAFAGDGAPYFGEGFAGQSEPTLPPLPSNGPNPAVITGAVLGGAAAFTILGFVLTHHHNAQLDYVVFDGGWQFQMILQQSLTLDASKVAAAAAVPPAH
jgi:hypothetical protein